MMQQQRMANDARVKIIYYLDLMGISHRSYFADKIISLKRSDRHWSKKTKI